MFLTFGCLILLSYLIESNANFGQCLLKEKYDGVRARKKVFNFYFHHITGFLLLV
jgi:hypothetical protein